MTIRGGSKRLFVRGGGATGYGRRATGDGDFFVLVFFVVGWGMGEYDVYSKAEPLRQVHP